MEFGAQGFSEMGRNAVKEKFDVVAVQASVLFDEALSGKHRSTYFVVEKFNRAVLCVVAVHILQKDSCSGQEGDNSRSEQPTVLPQKAQASTPLRRHQRSRFSEPCG